MTAFPISHSDRSRWQRRAAGELVRVLEVHPDLPVITWTVGPAGSVLVGRINALAPAAEVRSNFQSWRQALGLRELTAFSASTDEVLRLSASTIRNQVQIQLTATVIGGLS
jgi:hypothetical protein